MCEYGSESTAKTKYKKQQKTGGGSKRVGVGKRGKCNVLEESKFISDVYAKLYPLNQ